MKINNKEVKGIIFDFDGTLVDSASLWHDVDSAFFKKRGIPMPDDYAEKVGHMGLDLASEYTIKRFNLNENKEDIIKEWKDDVVKEYADNIDLKENVYEFLLKLHEENIPFCLATANEEECYVSCLKRNKVWDLFSFGVNVNKNIKGKDNPDIYLKCAEMLGLNPSECAVFEDLPLAINTCKKAGFITVFIKDDKNIYEENIADKYIFNYKELL